MNTPEAIDRDLTHRQLDRYAEDFGALFNEYHEIKSQFEKALITNRRAEEIQHSLSTLLQGIEEAGVIVTDGNGVINYATQAAALLIGQEKQAILGQPLASFVALQNRGTIGEYIALLGQSTNAALHDFLETGFACGNGQSLSGRVMRVPDPEQGYLLHWLLRLEISHTSVNDRPSELFSRLYACSTNGILVTDLNGKVISVNPAFTEITGYPEAEIIGKNPRFLSSGKQDAAFYKDMWRALTDKGEWQGEIWNRRKNGETYLEWLHILAVRDKAGTPLQYVGMFYDIGHYHKDQSHLYELANHDALTGLPNRTLCKDRLQQAIAQARRSTGSVGLLFIDLDRFKEINDTLGHAVGDLLLIEFSWRLVHVIRDSDTAARLGGDEFVIIAPSLTHEENIRAVVGKIINSLADPFVIEGRELYVGASIGVALYPAHGEDPDQLLRQADTAMYAAKSSGGNTYRLFDNHLEQTQQQRLDLESGLRRALAQSQLRLVYQPQVNSKTGALVGVEALLRWDWPEQGTIMPDRFIPIAEKTGLIMSIGAWALRAACLQFAAWRSEGLSPPRMAVNITARQINDDNFVQHVAKVIAETGLQPGELELEITETQLMEELHAGMKNLERLRALGVLIAVDDFGIGYSSLGRIKSLPIDRIKVDRSFIIDVDRNTDSYAIANAILGMARALKLETIAEGVERVDQARLLADIHCNEFQGYLFGQPYPPETIASLLKQQQGNESC